MYVVPQKLGIASDERRHGRGRRGNQQLDQMDTEPDTENGPTERVLPNQQATTKEGKPRQRMAWTREMNTTVMRCYYIATKLETFKIGYRSDLHRLFLQEYPELTHIVTPQRLIDQKRVILTNKRLTDQEIQTIKEEIAAQLNTYLPEEHNLPEELIQTEMQPTQTTTQQIEIIETPSTTTVPRPQVKTSLSAEVIHNELQENIIKWTGIDPINRPPLPKLIFKKHTNNIINTVNTLIKEQIENTITLEDLHLLVYASATTVIIQNKQLRDNKRNSNRKQLKPTWLIRIEKRIENIRKDLGRLTQYCRGNRSKQVIKQLKHIINKNNNETPIEALDTLKQKLAVYSTRLKRYTESNERRKQNAQFNTSQKQFYTSLTKPTDKPILPPNAEEIKQFWESMWSSPITHNESAPWIEEEQNKYKHIQQQANPTFTIEELTKTIQKTHNWKAPGVDHIHNYWYKKFTAIHQRLLKLINNIILEPQNMPHFLTQGKTYIKPKSEDTQNPANYRPITCLPTLYKIITSLITQKIDNHLTQNDIILEEQKGCRKNSRGCKEQIIIDTIIMKQIEKQQRNMNTCYIDYQKAFDSIPHTWLIKTLDIYKINNHIQKFLYTIMQTWRTTIQLNTNEHHIEIKDIKINRGIFQGDSLSALWFCLCLNPLSNLLNATTYGVKIKYENNCYYKINHLLYMDDIKIFAPDQKEMRSLLNLTEQFTQDTCMQFGINKCRILHIEKGKYKEHIETEKLNNQILKNMEPQETYKYLGFEQNTNIDHTYLKNQLKTKYKYRLTQIAKSKLNAKNITKAINSYAIPVLTYSFGIVKWSETDLEALNRLNRTTLTEHRKLHPKSCTERITLSRKEGGRGLVDIKVLHNTQIENLRKYFRNKITPLHRAILIADKQYTPLNLNKYSTGDNAEENRCTNPKQEKKDTWAGKALHGTHYAIMQNSQIDVGLSYKWLSVGQLFPETEGFLLAIQDRVIATKNYRKYILKERMDTDKCRKCLQFPETIEHITGGCKILAGTDYTDRHNTVAKIIHQELALKYSLMTTRLQYYKYTPENVMENETHKLYWDRTIHTDKTIINNRPDITLINKIDKQTSIIDIAVPNDSNVTSKEREKIEKYTPLAIEIQKMWKQNKVTIIPIVISVTGITTKAFSQHIQSLDLPPYIHTNMQKAVILKTTTIVRKFMQ